MKKATYRTQLDLKNLPVNGESFNFSRSTSELNDVLSDLIDPDQDYSVDINVKPAGNAFEINGHIQTKLHLLCSRCGRDLDYPVNDRFHELLVVTSEKPRAGHSGHTGGSLDDGLFCNYLTRYNLNLGDFVHEHVAAAEPFTIYCERPDCESVLKMAQDASTFLGDEDTNPFANLKNLKLKSHRD